MGGRLKKYDISVNGSVYMVEVENKKELDAIVQQRKIAKSVTLFMSKNATLVASLISVYISYCGLVLLWLRFDREGITLFDYISIPDLFFGFFSVPYAPHLIGIIFILMLLGYRNYLKVRWVFGKYGFWVIFAIYTLGAPFIVSFTQYSIWGYGLTDTCSDSEVKYEVVFSPPSTRIETELFLVASLNDYKIFKKSQKGCYVTQTEDLLDFYILAIPTNQIQSVEHKAVKQT